MMGSAFSSSTSQTNGEIEAKYKRQTSTSSEWPEWDPLMDLPNELTLHIFQYVPPRELVRACQLVSKRWYSFFSEPEFWKYRMNQGGNYSALLEEVPPSGINWARLCITAVHETNLVKSFDSEGKLSFSPWEKVYCDWNSFEKARTKLQNGKPVSDSIDRGARFGGGDRWTIESGWIKKDNPKDKEVLKENMGCVDNYVTSYGWCCREQYVILSKFGLTDEIMDMLQPAIEVSEWFAARRDCGSVFCIKIELIGETGKVIDEFSFSERTEQWKGGDLGWRKVEHVFRGYGPGVRFVRFADGGKDTQFWAGHYGSKMAAAWLKIKFT